MIPKEKAIELIEKMKWEGEMSDEDCFYDFAKQCALVAVDEILDVLWHIHNNEEAWRYYLEVKQEIEKL